MIYTKEILDIIDLAVERVEERFEFQDYKDFAAEVSDELIMLTDELPGIAYDGAACPRAWWDWYRSVPDEVESSSEPIS